MPEYYAYRTHISSDIQLPLPKAHPSKREPELYVRHGRVPETLSENSERIVRHMDGVFSFSIESGRRITVDPSPKADLNFIRSIIQGELIAAALRQRGLLVLHASCVKNDHGAVAFAGLPGWGKTTLAVHLLQKGFRLLTDDVLPIRIDTVPPKAVPSHPEARLRKEIGRKLYDDFDHLEDVHERTTKKRVNLDSHFSDIESPLKKVYILEGNFTKSNKIKRIGKPKQIFEIMRHTWANHLLDTPKRQKRHLTQSRILCNNSEVCILERKKSIRYIDNLTKKIEEDLL